MKIIYIKGGLGNQMFQYAFSIYLKQEHKCIYLFLNRKSLKNHQGFELTNVFPNSNSKVISFYIGKAIKFICKRILSKIGFLVFKNNKLPIDIVDNQGIFFDGYWQHYQYIKPIENQLRTYLTFKPIQDYRNKEMLQFINQTNAVSIHIRRGDYLNPSTRLLHGDICDLNYYKEAIKYMQQKVENPTFFIFSNDIVWVKQNIKIAHAYFIDWNINKDSYIDMQLMSGCKHHIIANSSFSWWGAWLNPFLSKIVVSPKKWYNMHNDITTELMHPKEWIKIGLVNPNVSLIIQEQIDDTILEYIFQQDYDDFEILYSHESIIQDIRLKTTISPIGKHIFELSIQEIHNFKQKDYLRNKLINYFCYTSK